MHENWIHLSIHNLSLLYFFFSIHLSLDLFITVPEAEQTLLDLI